MDNNQRTWINLIAGLVAVAIVVWLSPSPNYQPRGLLLPAQKIRTPILPTAVVQLPNRPFGGEVMGHINIERHYPSKQAKLEIATLAQQLASEVGANAVVVNNFRIGAVTKSSYIYLFRATAYYAPMLSGILESPQP